MTTHPNTAIPPIVGVVMGSISDWPIMQHTVATLKDFDITHDVCIVSAHRMPDDMFDYAHTAQKKGLSAIIAGAGGAAHLPGMMAAKTTLPVMGVPIPSKYLQGLDSLLSIVQMPKGIPVASFAIGESGAVNAALFAIALLATHDQALAKKLWHFRTQQTQKARETVLPVV